MWFLKIQILPQNTNVLAFGFFEKLHFLSKTDQNSIFLSRESHILDYITVLYICFYELKNPKFGSKSKCFNLPKNTSLWQKLTKTLYFVAVKPIFRFVYS
jgi:hypothetical protein